MKRSAMGDLRSDVTKIVLGFKIAGFNFIKKDKSKKSRSVYLTFRKPEYSDQFEDEVTVRVSDHSVGQYWNSYTGDMKQYDSSIANIRIDCYRLDYSFDDEIKNAIKDCLDYLKTAN